MHQLGLLAGLIGMPVVLLALGHRLRYRTRTAKRLFFGGVIGHTAGLIISVVAMLSPAISWAGGGDVRTLLVHWSMLVGVALGWAAAALWRAT
jgi:hypothetical protein